MFSSIRVNKVHRLIQRLLTSSNADENGMVEMKSAFFELTLNIIMRMIGKRYSGDDAGQNEGITRFQEMAKESIKVSGSTNIADFVPLLKWIGQNKFKNYLKTLQVKRENLVQDLIEERRRIILCGSENKTLIDTLLSLQQLKSIVEK